MPDLSLTVFVVLVLLAASSGILFQPKEWYRSLKKPGWTPPNWLFGPVWLVLYVMIVIAGYRVWSVAGMSLPIVFWGAQLVFNALWSFLFFGRRRMDLAFNDAIAMWLSIAGFIVTAWPVSHTASLLFVPYLVWVTIAAALNRTVWRLNPAA